MARTTGMRRNTVTTHLHTAKHWKEDQTMPAYIVARVDVDDPALLMPYQAATSPILEKYRGRFLARGGPTVTLEGPLEPRHIVIIEFPELTDAEAFYHSPEYTEARKLRDGVAVIEFIAVDGVES